jgi:hypothetical protein
MRLAGPIALFVLALGLAACGVSAPSNPPCTAVNFALGFLGGSAYTGHGELGFVLRNEGRAGCRTFGYPSVRFLDARGRPLPTRAEDRTQDFFGYTPRVRLTVAPGDWLSFRLETNHAALRCRVVYGLRIGLPGGGSAQWVSPRQLLDNTCAGGWTRVSPLQPGGAYP